MTSEYRPPRYFVVERATGILRAAQSTYRGALKYSTPDRVIVRPMTPAEFPPREDQ
jgi:hypothetical protein